MFRRLLALTVLTAAGVVTAVPAAIPVAAADPVTINVADFRTAGRTDAQAIQAAGVACEDHGVYAWGAKDIFITGNYGDGWNHHVFGRRAEPAQRR